MKHLYFIRHGQSVMNTTGQLGGTSNTPLTEEGHRQAKVAAKRARDNNLRFDIILSSPLDRAIDTARYIATHTKYPVDAIQIYDKLIERHFGVIDGQHESVIDFDGKAYVADPFYLDHIEDIETATALQARAEEVLAYLHTLPHDTVLVASHAAFGRALRRAIQKESLHNFGERIDNATILKFI